MADQKPGRETYNASCFRKAKGTSGHVILWGIGHPAVFSNDDGQIFIVHQGRPGVDRFYMMLHVREFFWTEEGWPVVNPERYTGIAQTEILQEELLGQWERIVFGYTLFLVTGGEDFS